MRKQWRNTNWETFNKVISCILQKYQCHKRQRKAEESSKFKKSGEMRQLKAICHPRLGKNPTIKDIIGTVLQCGL